MTLSARNNLFKAGIAFSFLCLLICIAASLRVIAIYASMEPEMVRRSEGIWYALTGKFFDLKLLAAHFGIAAAVLYSFLSMVLIYYFFEKTQSPEIFFVGLFAVSFSLEALRLILPLGWVYEIPSLYLLIAMRIMLFCRYFGLFSLFTASVYAVGLEVQRQRNVVMIISIITLVIALGVPIDSQVWDSSLTMIYGYAAMFRFIEAGIFLITAISFFIATWARGTREFIFIGTGSILVFFGRNMLLTADTWVGLPGGLLLLAIGTWLICTRLHKIYLWL
jgi:hypothetical protein